MRDRLQCHTHWGSGCRASPYRGQKQVSPSLSLRNSSAKNGNNYAHLAHSMGRENVHQMPNRMLFAHYVFIGRNILSFYKYCQQAFFQARRILCSLQSRMWSKSLINSFNKYLFSICTVQYIKKQRYHFADKSPYSQSCGFSSSHKQM